MRRSLESVIATEAAYPVRDSPPAATVSRITVQEILSSGCLSVTKTTSNLRNSRNSAPIVDGVSPSGFAIAWTLTRICGVSADKLNENEQINRLAKNGMIWSLCAGIVDVIRWSDIQSHCAVRCKACRNQSIILAAGD